LKFAYCHRTWRSPLTLSELPFRLWCQGQGVTIDALDVLWAQLTRDLSAIAKFLYIPHKEQPKLGYTEIGQRHAVQWTTPKFLEVLAQVVFDRHRTRDIPSS